MHPPIPLSSRALALPVDTALRLLPDALHTRFFSILINHLLKGQPLADELGPLEDKRICLSVADTGNEIAFLVRTNRMHAYRCRHDRDWDVRIRGRLRDFWRLAARIEDPDTLFFHRDLELEGETEAGLYLKNLLDGMEFDWESHVHAIMGQSLGRGLVAAVHRTGLDRAAHRLFHAEAPPVRSPR
jgi:O2-independent ubiquinone biosynthesis accessory factor UbiT